LLLTLATTTSALRLHRVPNGGASPLARREALALGLASGLAVSTQPVSADTPPTAAAPPTAARSVRESIEALRAAPPSDSGKPLPSRSLFTRRYFTRETADVEYPSWFQGSWKCTSTLEQVVAPGGAALFTPGRNGTEALRRARLDVGQPLQYGTRWRKSPTGEGTWVVDRAFNTQAISAASMGPKAVQNCEVNGADQVELILRPDAAGKTIYRASLDVLARHTEPIAREDYFDCVETVRQTVLLVPGDNYNGPRRPPMVKEVETFCTYDRLPNGSFTGVQRTATFLVPDAAYTSGASLAEQQAIQLLRGPDGMQTALDVRVYTLLYERA
jgi:hypothetical protein